MAIIPVGYGEVHFRFGGSAFPFGAEVTIGFQNAAPSTAAGAAAAFVTNWTSNIRGQHTTHTTLEEVLVKLGPNSIGPSASVFPALAGTGDTQDAMPSVAVLVAKHTPLGGRKHRGRSYWPILSEVEYGNGGTIDSTSLAGVATAMENFRLDAASADLPLYLLHGDATAPDEIIALVPDSRYATQRRRLRG